MIPTYIKSIGFDITRGHRRGEDLLEIFLCLRTFQCGSNSPTTNFTNIKCMEVYQEDKNLGHVFGRHTSNPFENIIEVQDMNIVQFREYIKIIHNCTLGKWNLFAKYYDPDRVLNQKDKFFVEKLAITEENAKEDVLAFTFESDEDAVIFKCKI